MVTVALNCMVIHGRMYEYAVDLDDMQVETRLETTEVGKPLQYKAFRVFPDGVAATPTKAMDLYSNDCLNIHRAMYGYAKK